VHAPEHPQVRGATVDQVAQAPNLEVVTELPVGAIDQQVELISTALDVSDEEPLPRFPTG
jgi:hypothetical protein